MRTIKLFLFILSVNSLLSQSSNPFLTSEERAYFYRVAMQSPVLYRNIGNALTYQGEYKYQTVKHTKKLASGDKIERIDTLIDYDFIEEQIIYEPSLLEISMKDLSLASTGVLSEAAAKIALWKLYKELKRRDEDKPTGVEAGVLDDFKSIVLQYLPDKAVRERSNGERAIQPKLDGLFNPNLKTNDRIAIVNGLSGYTTEEKTQVLQAFNKAVNQYISIKAEEYFLKIGGKKSQFNNMLLAAGDGSATEGLLGERERNARGKFYAGDPKGIGLFTYELTVGLDEKNNPVIKTEKEPIERFELLGDNKLTNLHLSIWGFNSDYKTTVAITKGVKTYLLYSSRITRELTPNSAAGRGLNYHDLLFRLEHQTIPFLVEEIEGKKGLKYWVKYYEEQSALNIENLKKTEAELDEMRHNSVKKGGQVDSKQRGRGHPVPEVKKSEKNKIAQQKLIYYYNRKTEMEKKLRESKENLAAAEKKLMIHQLRLQKMKQNLGNQQQKYTVSNQIFTFEDGSTFNAFTQDFQFVDKAENEEFEIRLLAIGQDAMSELVDEVQLHINVSEGRYFPTDIKPIHISFTDVYKSDEFKLSQFELEPWERYELSEMLNQLLLSKSLEFNLWGNGVGKRVGSKVLTDEKQVELDKYPGENKQEQEQAKSSDDYRLLRMSSLDVQNNEKSIVAIIHSYTDPIKSKLTYKKTEWAEVKKQLTVTDNQLLSALRTFDLLEYLCTEMVIVAHYDFDSKQSAKLIAKIEKALSQSIVKVGTKELSYSKYKALVYKGKTSIIQDRLSAHISMAEE
ncbi:MAG: hypothetical protein ACK4K0_08945 [Flavobacteriales bacterium]